MGGAQIVGGRGCRKGQEGGGKRGGARGCSKGGVVRGARWWNLYLNEVFNKTA